MVTKKFKIYISYIESNFVEIDSNIIPACSSGHGECDVFDEWMCCIKCAVLHQKNVPVMWWNLCDDNEVIL